MLAPVSSTKSTASVASGVRDSETVRKVVFKESYGLSEKQYLAALHSVRQAVQFPVGHRHVVLAHGSILEAPPFTIIIDKFSRFTGEEKGFFVILLTDTNKE